MIKVLVDRELLCHALSGGVKGERARSELRGMLSRAQPAEAEGVAVVGYAVTWIRAGETPEETVFMSTADFEATGGPRFYSYREPLVLQSAHLDALSAVTAERDQSISLTADYIAMLGEAGLQIDLLTAEVEMLRNERTARESMARRLLWLAFVWNDHNFLEEAHIVARREAEAHGITTLEQANEWLSRIDATLAAKEA